MLLLFNSNYTGIKRTKLTEFIFISLLYSLHILHKIPSGQKSSVSTILKSDLFIVIIYDLYFVLTCTITLAFPLKSL